MCVCVCVCVCVQNPIIMDIPVELPQVKVKVLQCTTRRRVVVAKETTDGSGGSDTDEATNAVHTSPNPAQPSSSVFSWWGK